QEAHEAIRPTDLSKKTAGNNPEQQKLYQLIWSRTIASQMADAKTLRTKLSVKVGKDSDDSKKENAIPDFSINGSRVLFDGWLRADPEARQD
ncbi:TPA: DNA topoisomerase I, partial [Candidatus Taylorbacteria bacterium]|nr:DNA topoisomerase I [Candidatus Taylorbacteria bacterium]